MRHAQNVRFAWSSEGDNDLGETSTDVNRPLPTSNSTLADVRFEASFLPAKTACYLKPD